LPKNDRGWEIGEKIAGRKKKTRVWNGVCKGWTWVVEYKSKGGLGKGIFKGKNRERRINVGRAPQRPPEEEIERQKDGQ